MITQTPETLQLILLGGSRKTYLTDGFQNMSPNNLSTNFRLNMTFGNDYRHQSICTREVPEQLQIFLRQGLENEGYGKDLLNLKVEFKEAGASSLDYAILADFSVKAAEHHDALARCLQRMAVDACNQYGWEIPFAQNTLHQAEGFEEKEITKSGNTK